MPVPVVIDDLEATALAAAIDVSPNADVHVEHNQWVEVAVPFLDDKLCLNCHVPVGPAWTLVDEVGDMRGTYGRGRCPSCQQVGSGWAVSGHLDMKGRSPEAVRRAVASATARAVSFADRRRRTDHNRINVVLSDVVRSAVHAARAKGLRPVAESAAEAAELSKVVRSAGMELVASGYGLTMAEGIDGTWRFSASARDPWSVGGSVVVADIDLVWPTDDEPGEDPAE